MMSFLTRLEEKRIPISARYLDVTSFSACRSPTQIGKWVLFRKKGIEPTGILYLLRNCLYCVLLLKFGALPVEGKLS